MTLASRISTHANIGNLDVAERKWKICLGNLVLDQLQAIVCGVIAALIAVFVGYITEQVFHPEYMLILVSVSILTASVVSIVLGSTMVTVILLSRKYRVNPDNLATPVCAFYNQ